MSCLMVLAGVVLLLLGMVSVPTSAAETQAAFRDPHLVSAAGCAGPAMVAGILLIAAAGVLMFAGT